MTIQPDAPTDSWITEIVRCVGLSRTDATALQIAATALAMIKTAAARPAAVDCLVTLAAVENAAPVRAWAVYGFGVHGQVPAAAWMAVSEMLFSDDATLRQIAFGAALPHAIGGAGALASKAAEVGPKGWTADGLALLAASAGSAESKQRQVEAYITRSLHGESATSALVAGYVALARLNPRGVGAVALAKIAGAAQILPDAVLALTALGQLGTLGRPAVPLLVEQLINTDDPEREDLLCRALLQLEITEREVPLTRALQRIECGPDKTVFAHCIFLSMYRESFARAAPVLAKRFTTSSEALKPLLDAVYKMLTGRQLTVDAPTNLS